MSISIPDDLRERLDLLMPREARWAYFQKGRGPMFVYNTERIKTSDPNDVANGRFESAVFVPVGPGSRSGRATSWRIDDSTRSLHTLRKDAKARALWLYERWLDGNTRWPK